MDNITEAIVIEEEAPRRGRRPAARSGAAPAPAVEQQAAGLVADLRRDSITMPRQELAQSLHMAGATGMIAAFQYNETANRVAMLSSLPRSATARPTRGPVWWTGTARPAWSPPGRSFAPPTATASAR